MALGTGKLRCQGLLQAPVATRRSSLRVPAVKPRTVAQPVSKPRLPGRSGLAVVRAAADTSEAIELVLPAEEVLQTLKIGQNQDGRFIVEDIIEGSVADQKSIQKGSVVTAVSDPAAPGNLWQLEARSSLRHVLDQMRMQQSSQVKLVILPPSAADEEATGRLGLNRDGPVMNEKTAARRQQQREEFLDRDAANNPTNWLALGVGVVLVPAAVILGLAISTGFLDQQNAGWAGL